MDPKTLARAIKVLAAPARVEIVRLLKARALCVNALAARLKVTQGAVSQHLRIMRDAGLVCDDRRGCFVHYRLNDKTLAAWRSEIDRLLDPAAGAVETAQGARPWVAATSAARDVRHPCTGTIQGRRTRP